jgi:hypothetical protein
MEKNRTAGTRPNDESTIAAREASVFGEKGESPRLLSDSELRLVGGGDGQPAWP